MIKKFPLIQQALLVFIVIIIFVEPNFKAQMRMSSPYRATDTNIHYDTSKTKTTKISTRLDALLDSLDLYNKKLDSISNKTKNKTILLKSQQKDIKKQTDEVNSLITKKG